MSQNIFRKLAKLFKKHYIIIILGIVGFLVYYNNLPFQEGRRNRRRRRRTPRCARLKRFWQRARRGRRRNRSGRGRPRRNRA